MRPTVGRIVHYTPTGDLYDNPHGVHPPQAAIITVVAFKAESMEVSLTIFPPLHGTHTESKVPFSETYKKGHWTWPPRT